MRPIAKVGIVGTGVIGSGWAARCLAQGLEVVASDPAPDAEEKLRQAIDKAWPAMRKLSSAPAMENGRLSFTPSLKELAQHVDWIQECAPEREHLKRALLAELDAHTRPEVIIASSSSGLLPTKIQADCAQAHRVLIGHPFNPVYLLPLVEIVAGQKTSQDAVDRAITFYRSIGMYPLHVRNEIEGYLSDRLQEAVWREILHLVKDGVATTGELDDAITYGPGLRWAIMGTCLTFHLAGGELGMRHMLEQFGPALELPWTKLKAPQLTAELINQMVDGTQAQAGSRTIDGLERLRDDVLVDILSVLRRHQVGPGKILAEAEARHYSAHPYRTWQKGAEVETPLKLYRTAVQPDWLDYNGHMSESYYLYAFGDAGDAFFRYIGINEDYRTQGFSFYTVENHINYLAEVSSGEPLEITTLVLGMDEKRLHFFHEMYHGVTGKLLSTAEQMLLHVDTKAQKGVAMKPQVLEVASAVWAAHKTAPKPAHLKQTMQIPHVKGLS